MKIISVIIIFVLFSCSDATEQKVDVPKTEINKAEKSEENHPTIKGHQDMMKRAKNMEKEVLDAAEKQKKTIDNLDD